MCSKNRRNALIGFFITGICIILYSESAEAVPSFARRYKTSCITCHTIYPALNDYGRLFRAKGYRLPGSGKNITGEIPLGLGVRVEEKGRNPLDLPFIDLPASSVASFQVLSNFNFRPDEKIKTEFTGISSFGLIFGGAMGEHFSFFGNIALIEDGKFEGVDRLFLQYNYSLSFNARVGQFEPRAIPFSNHRRLLRITPYLHGVFPVLPAQNFFGFSPNQKGLEMFGQLPGPGGIGDFDYAFGILNGEPGGAFEALEEVEPVEELLHNLEEAYEESGGEFDFNNAKDLYARLNYTTWVHGSFSAGSFIYRGKSGFLMDTEDPESFVDEGNTFTRWGLDYKWDQGNGYVTVLGALQFFNDELDRPMIKDLSVRIIMNEIQAYIHPWLVPGFRVEQVKLTDFPAMFPETFERYNFDLLMLTASNIMLMAGYTWSSGDAPELPLFAEKSRISLHLAF